MDFRPDLFYLQALFPNVKMEMSKIKRFAGEWPEDRPDSTGPSMSLCF